jgi:hypothetical protein
MPDNIRQPVFWTVGTSAGLVCCVGLALLFAGFCALALLHHYGVQAVTFGVAGTVGMLGFALTQWRTMKHLRSDPAASAVKRRSGPARS